MAAGVLAQMFAEIPPGLAARLVQGAAVNPAGPEAEAEAGAGAEGSVGGVKGLLMFSSLRSWVCAPDVRFETSRYIEN